MRSAAIIGVVISCAWVSAAEMPKFRMQEIDHTLKIGYGVILADINGDGKPDIVVADQARVIWLENVPSIASEAFFVAPGFVAQHFVTTTVGSTTVNGAFTPVRQACSYVGPSLDLGGQFVAPFGLAMGGSIGVHYRAAIGSFDESTYPWTWSLTDGPGLRPRFRVWLGWAFL